MNRLAQNNFVDFQGLESGLGSGYQSKFSGATIGTIISTLIPYAFVLAGLLLLAFIVFGGYSMMTSQGDPKALQSSKEKITAGLIGFVIVFLSYWIVQIIARVLGLNQIIQIFG